MLGMYLGYVGYLCMLIGLKFLFVIGLFLSTWECSLLFFLFKVSFGILF